MPDKIKMNETETGYESKCGLLLIRHGKNQRWTLFDKDSNMIDQDPYRHDLAQRNNLILN